MVHNLRLASCTFFLSFLACKSTTDERNGADLATFVSTVKPSVNNPAVKLQNTHKVDDRVFRGNLPIDPSPEAKSNSFAPLTTDVLAAYDASGRPVDHGNLNVTDVLILDSRFNADVIGEMAALSKLGVTPAADYTPADYSPESLH